MRYLRLLAVVAVICAYPGVAMAQRTSTKKETRAPTNAYGQPRVAATGFVLDRTAPTPSPPIGAGRPIPVLPFNGETLSYSATGGPSYPEKGQAGAGSSKEGAGRASFKIQGKVTVTDSRGNPTLNASCRETQQLSVSGDFRLSVEAGATRKGTGVSGTGTKGVTFQYQLNLAPQQVGALRAGAMGSPNPLDPRTISTGDSIVLSELSYGQLDLGGAYHGLTIDLGYKTGRQVSSGIQALEGGVVQVDVGDSQLVQNALTLGIGDGDFGASVGASNTYTEGKLRQVDININTPTGWATYQQFLHTGVLPTTSDPGVANPATQQIVTDISQLQAEAHLFGLSIGISSSPSQSNYTETDNSDGSKTGTVNYRLRDVTEVVTSHTDSAGDNTGATYQLLLHNVSPSTANEYAQLTGQSGVDYRSNRDVVLNFTAAQLGALQQMAVEKLSAITNQPRFGPPKSPQQVRQLFQHNPFATLPGMYSDAADGIPLFTLAAAKNPAQILQAIQDAGNGDASVTLRRLGQFEFTAAETLHRLKSHPPSVTPDGSETICA